MEVWTRHLMLFLGTFASLWVVVVLLVWSANPYGNLPGSPLAHVLMDDNQRFQYPAVIRSHRYDSLVVGTSTSRLLEPKALEGIFAGRFANLALNSGTAWEQWQIALLFQHEVSHPRTLVVALDHVWCAVDAHVKRITHRGFPEWLFDDNPWNDLLYMLNARTVEISGRRIGHALGLMRERWPHDGYEIFVPRDTTYDAARAREHIYGSQRPQAAIMAISDSVPPEMMARAEATSKRPDEFPAHAWLESLLAAKRFQRVVLFIAPVHIVAQPRTPPEQERELACKVSLAAIAARHGQRVVDFRIPSSITREDSHYWDPLHIRVPIAARVVEALDRALKTDASDPNGDWRILRVNP